MEGIKKYFKNDVKTTYYSNKLIVKKTNKRESASKENKNYGIEYENSICTKSCVFLKIKSINDINIYSKQYRHFSGLKLLLLKQNKND